MTISESWKSLAARRDFVHIDDAVDAMALLLTSGEGGEIYNLGSGQAHSIDEALHELIEISGLSPVVVVDPERFRPVDLPLLQADISRLCSLGWKPRRNLNDALRDLWLAMLESGSGMPASGASSSSTA